MIELVDFCELLVLPFSGVDLAELCVWDRLKPMGRGDDPSGLVGAAEVACKDCVDMLVLQILRRALSLTFSELGQLSVVVAEEASGLVADALAVPDKDEFRHDSLLERF